MSAQNLRVKFILIRMWLQIRGLSLTQWDTGCKNQHTIRKVILLIGSSKGNKLEIGSIIGEIVNLGRIRPKAESISPIAGGFTDCIMTQCHHSAKDDRNMIIRTRIVVLTLGILMLLGGCSRKRDDASLFCYPDLQHLFEQYLDLSDDVFDYYDKGHHPMRPLCSITIDEATRDDHTDTIIDLWRSFEKTSWTSPEGDEIPERGATIQKKTVCIVIYLQQDSVDMTGLLNEEILQPANRLIQFDQQECEYFLEYLTRISFIIHRPNPISIDISYIRRNHNEYYGIEYRNGKAFLSQSVRDE